MTAQEILKLIEAGFTADEIRTINGSAQPDLQPDPAPDPQPAPAPAAPEEPDPPAQNSEPSPDPEPAPAAPAWFEEFVKRNNAEMAAMQRALQITNVRRAAPAEPQKTPEQLMAEAYQAIVD